MSDDSVLLRRFLEDASDVTFRELVLSRFDFVYATALRRVGGDTHLAREVAQDVFVDLARKARNLADRPNLLGWLHTSTRFAAAKALRSLERRLKRETEAHAEEVSMSARSDDEITWSELRPALDDALGELNARDREAILLRFFDGLSHREVGTVLGVTEDAARMRVERALRGLRDRFHRRGIASTAAGASLAVASTSAVSLGAVFPVLYLMNCGRLIAGTIGAAALMVGVYYGTQYRSSRLETTESTLSGSTGATDARSREPARMDAINPTRTSEVQSAARLPNQTLDRLSVLTELQQHNLVKTEIDLLEGSTRLSPAFTELFALTVSEQAALQRALESAQGTLADLERAHATVTPQANGNVVIAVRSFPEEGGQVYDAVLKRFADTLGPERYRAFLALGSEEVEKALGRFGTPQRTITFSRIVGADNAVLYTMREELKLPRENSNYTSDFKTYEELAKQAGTVVKLLPPNFAP